MLCCNLNEADIGTHSMTDDWLPEKKTPKAGHRKNSRTLNLLLPHPFEDNAVRHRREDVSNDSFLIIKGGRPIKEQWDVTVRAHSFGWNLDF